MFSDCFSVWSRVAYLRERSWYSLFHCSWLFEEYILFWMWALFFFSLSNSSTSSLHSLSNLRHSSSWLWHTLTDFSLVVNVEMLGRALSLVGVLSEVVLYFWWSLLLTYMFWVGARFSLFSMGLIVLLGVYFCWLAYFLGFRIQWIFDWIIWLTS